MNPPKLPKMPSLPDISTVRRRAWTPGHDPRAVLHPAPAPRATGRPRPERVVVVGGGIAGLAAATALAERGVPVTLLELQSQLGGRVRAWPREVPGTTGTSGTEGMGHAVTMSRGFHAFFRQYYNLRALLRRTDPGLERLRPIEDYPLIHVDGHRDSFTSIPRTPPLNMLAFVARSPSFTAGALARVDVNQALKLLDVDFPATFTQYDGVSAAEVLDRLNFPEKARHLALEVFARSFFADPREFSGGELVGMFHTYFLGSAEGLLFDVPDDDYDSALWAPLGRYLFGLGVDIVTNARVMGLEERGDRIAVVARTEGQTTQDSWTIDADAVVLATDTRPLQRFVETAPWLGGLQWRSRVAALRSSPPFAVWRLWFDTPVAADSPPFLGTAGFGRLDNISILEQFEGGAADWAAETGGSVVELHAYALEPGVDEEALRAELREQLLIIHPELADAVTVAESWLVRDDCPLVGTSPWLDRPGVVTPDARVVLAGDGIRCEFPVALMERAATTGFQAANELLAQWGLPGHELWTVPVSGRHPRAVDALSTLSGLLPHRR